MFYIKIFVVVVFCASMFDAKDFTVGTKTDNILINTEKVLYRSIPLIRRDKDYSYVDTKERVIKGIIARDLDKSGASVEITSGGVGHSNVTLHLQSDRGSRLNYLILIFSNKIK